MADVPGCCMQHPAPCVFSEAAAPNKGGGGLGYLTYPQPVLGYAITAPAGKALGALQAKH
jgi:hypothetical protein